MAPLRKKITRYLRRHDELLDSGPVTLRSARFEVAAPVASVASAAVSAVAPSIEVASGVDSGVRSADEISGVMPVARRLMAEEASVSSGSWSVDPESFLFDEDVCFADCDEDAEPSTVRMPSIYPTHDSEPPPPTLRSAGR
ncbi:MAG: hypothetical protein EOO75_20645 [Myxococcales bacterium]|nr:MAG: hypothetical protein EOO75_20645 [Myxococcales bacterium]